MRNLAGRHFLRILNLKQDEKVSELFLSFVFEVWHTHVLEGHDLAWFDNFAFLGCYLKGSAVEVLDTKFNACNRFYQGDSLCNQEIGAVSLKEFVLFLFDDKGNISLEIFPSFFIGLSFVEEFLAVWSSFEYVAFKHFLDIIWRSSLSFNFDFHALSFVQILKGALDRISNTLGLR